VLFNFTVFFLLTNIPYVFIAATHAIHFVMGISIIVALVLVLIVLKRTHNVKHATYFFMINFTIQDVGHYFINNGRMSEQGILFSLLFVLCGFLLLDRYWGSAIGLLIVVMYILGVYNLNNNLAIWHVPPGISDPEETGTFKYMAILPMFLNMYLILEFVKARQKAEKQLSEQKKIIEEKQKEIIDSFRYARRIQRSLLANEKYIEKTVQRLKPKK
jgi:hypothetical protein